MVWSVYCCNLVTGSSWFLNHHVLTVGFSSVGSLAVDCTYSCFNEFRGLVSDPHPPWILMVVHAVCSLPRRSMASPRAPLSVKLDRDTDGMSQSYNSPGAHTLLSSSSNVGQVVRNLGDDGSWGSPIVFATPRLVSARSKQTHRWVR